jgi:hypothetical protein
MMELVLDSRPPGALKVAANENAFYLMATLYGEPPWWDHVIKAQNRLAWNRYFASHLKEAERKRLVAEGFSVEDLTPLSFEEQQEIAEVFLERQGLGHQASPPAAQPSPDAFIDFTQVKFACDIGFDGYFFPNVSFSDAEFGARADFKQAVFLESVDFDGAIFTNGVVFENTLFVSAAQFEATTFVDWFTCKNAIFNGSANFENAIFDGGANFERASFSLWAAFNCAKFLSAANFETVQFSGGVNFEAAIFAGGACFTRTNFKHWASFARTDFYAASQFVNAEMHDKCSFDGASFLNEPPQFFGAKLHEGMNWESIIWPKPNGPDRARSFIMAYERLKHEMERLHKRADAMDFFVLEMQSRRILQGPFFGLPLALYWFVSNYGRSYVWPLIMLFATVVAGIGAYRWFGGLPPDKALSFSIANTFGMMGVKTDLALAVGGAPRAGWLYSMSAVQTLAGVTFLLLFVVGMLNRFRLK